MTSSWLVMSALILAIISMVMVRLVHAQESAINQILGLPITDDLGAKKVAFWNIYADGDNIQEVLDAQRENMIKSGLMDQIDYIIYFLHGPMSFAVSLEGEKFIQYPYMQDEFTEMQTYSVLYDYCKLDTKGKVLSLHMKGSSNIVVTNHKMRKALDCFILNPNCIDALDRHDICGWRLTAYPYLHYFGNYWWANCYHINALIDPRRYYENATFINDMNLMVLKYASMANNATLKAMVVNETAMAKAAEDERWAHRRLDAAEEPATAASATAEAAPAPPAHVSRRLVQLTSTQEAMYGVGEHIAASWIASKPDFLPADCMSKEGDPTYSTETTIPQSVYKLCPTYEKGDNPLDINHTFPEDYDKVMCSVSSVALDSYTLIKQKLSPQWPYLDFMKERSEYWYGEPPEALVTWQLPNHNIHQPLCRIYAMEQINVTELSNLTIMAPYESAEEEKRIKKKVLPKLKFIIYIIYHDEVSKKLTFEFAKTNKWAVPKFTYSTSFFESILYRDLFLVEYKKWKGLDYVGMYSYKVASSNVKVSSLLPVFKGTMTPEILARAKDKGHNFVPFLRSPIKMIHQATWVHSLYWYKIWDTMLMSMGYNQEQIRSCDNTTAFFRSAYGARPDVQLDIAKWMDMAISIVEHNKTVSDLFETDCRYTAHSDLAVQRKIWNTTYWKFHPFVFERLLVFYACIHDEDRDVKQCKGPESICRNYFCG